MRVKRDKIVQSLLVGIFGQERYLSTCLRILWIGFVCIGGSVLASPPPQSYTLSDLSEMSATRDLGSNTESTTSGRAESKRSQDSHTSQGVPTDGDMHEDTRARQEKIRFLQTQIQQLQDQVDTLKGTLPSEKAERKRYGIFIGGGFGGLHIYDESRGEDFSIVPFVLRAGYQRYFGFLGVRAYAESANGAETHEGDEDVMHIGYVNLHSLNFDVMLDAHFEKFSVGVFGGISGLFALYRNQLQYDDEYSVTYKRHSNYLSAYNVGMAFTWHQIHRIEASYRIMPTQESIRAGNMLSLVYQYVF